MSHHRENERQAQQGAPAFLEPADDVTHGKGPGLEWRAAHFMLFRSSIST